MDANTATLELIPETPSEAPTSNNPKDLEEVETLRFSTFMDCYLDKTSATFGNATQSYIKAYDPDNKLSYGAQRKNAHKLVTKGDLLVREYMEQNGLGLPSMVNVAAQKMHASENPKWWENLMELSGYKTKGKSIEGTNVQINQFNIYGQEVEEFNKNFLKFIEQQV